MVSSVNCRRGHDRRPEMWVERQGVVGVPVPVDLGIRRVD